MITNNIDEKKYIGQAIDVQYRWKQHIRNSKHNKLKSRYLYAAFNKYGIENFLLEVIESDVSEEIINDREKYWIAYYQTFAPNGYNLTHGGEGSLGRKQTEKTRKKMSDKSRKWHDENNELFQEIIKGRNMDNTRSSETIKKRTNSWKSNPENKEKFVNNAKKYRKTETDEQKQKRYAKSTQVKKEKGYDFYNFSFGKMTEDELKEMHIKAGRNNKTCQPVLMLDQEENILKEFYSLSEATKYIQDNFGYKNPGHSNITAVLDTNKIAYKHRWKRK